jgi:hypothetical protein
VKLEDGSEKEAYTYYPSEILIKNYTWDRRGFVWNKIILKLKKKTKYF